MTDVTGAEAAAPDPTVDTSSVPAGVDLDAEIQNEKDALHRRVEKAQAELAGAEAALAAAGG